MSIEIDKRSDYSAYITVGDIIIYVEHSSVAPEHIVVWKSGEITATMFEHDLDYEPLETKVKA